jgi:hypothetical protein
MRDNAKAAGTLISIVIVTTITDTSAELRKKVRYCDDVRSSR